MPNCCVPGCKNSSHKGYLMKCFPKNKRRREIWISNVNRPSWIPHSANRICEVHFTSDMWEKTRVDGSQKLKYNAIPTVFGDEVVNKPPMGLSELPPKKGNNNKSGSKNEEKNLLKSITLDHHTLIKILPSNTANSISAPIIVPLKGHSIKSSGTIIVNSKGQIVNSSVPHALSEITGILKPVIKTTSAQSSPMLISTNANILKNQIKAASNQMPIIIPAANSSILKSHMKNNSSQSAVNNIIAIKPKPLPTQVFINASGNESKQPDDSTENVSTSTSSGIILNKAEAQKMNEERFKKMDKLLLKQLKLNNALRNKLRLTNIKIQQLIKEQNRNSTKSFLKDVFTDDQVRALELKQVNPKSITAWSQKTMIKALKLKQECGTRGYEELLKQHMPLPSIRTLTRWCTTKEIPIP